MFDTTPLGIPIYPQPSIFETTSTGLLTDDGVIHVTPALVEQISARPSWNYHEAEQRLAQAAQAQQATARPTVTKRTRTPRKKP